MLYSVSIQCKTPNTLKKHINFNIRKNLIHFNFRYKIVSNV